MKKKFTFMMAALMLLVFMTSSLAGWGQTTYEQLTSIANIDENAQYVLGIDGTGFHYSNTSGWGLTGLPEDHTPYYYRLVVAEDGQSFKAYIDTPIYGKTYYMTIPTSNAFTMMTSSDADNTDLIIGTTCTGVSTPNYAVANKTTTARHLRRNGTSGLRSYAGTTGSIAYFYKVVTSSGPVQLDAPTLTATSSNGKVTLTWDNVNGASSYTVQYADNSSFTGATTITNATSPNEISGLTNGTTYYFKAMSVGDGTDYLSSDYCTAISSTPSNYVTITITQDDIEDFTNTYNWYDWSDGGVSGKLYAYKNAGMQFNSSKTAYWIYNSTAVPGKITSVKMTKASGTDRSWTLKAGNTALTATSDGTQIGNAQTVGTNGATWDVSGSYDYFLLYVGGGSTVISSIEITYTPTSASDPSISADDVEIAYDATSGSIMGEIVNYVEGTVSATTDADWISNFTYDQTDEIFEVDFDATVNPSAVARTANVTLTFTYGNNETITQNVIVSQTGNPDGPGTENNPYTVAQAIANTPSSGNVYIQGIVSSFYSTSIVGDGNNFRYYISDDGGTTTQLLVYKGTGLNQATFTNADDLLVGDEVVIYGSLITYQNAPEVASDNYLYTWNRPTHPIIIANDINLAYDATSGSIAYSISNPTSATLTASSGAGWISNITVGAESVTFTTTANEGDADRSATITLSYTGADDKVITVTQAHYVPDYATLPFEFVGNEAIPTGITTNAGTYNASPYLKFDATGKYLVLKLVEAPVSISYDIKGNSFSGGTFKVQVSANGTEYTDVETYTSLGNTQTITLLNSDDNVRYIKWVYTTKSSGNVALGNLYVTTDMIINGDCTVNDFTISNTDVLTIEAGSVMTVTGTLANNGDETNLIIEDGGQLITSKSVKATFKKTTTASTGAKAATNNWYAISSPVDEIAISSFATGTHNVYSYVEKSHYWNEYRGEENTTLGTAPFTNLENGRGYLYRSTASGIDFKGDVNIDDATYKLTYTSDAGKLAGFHLIGNPFSYNIYKGVDIPNTYLEDNFYTLTPEGGWELGYDSGATEPTAIKPNTGILVQAISMADGQDLIIAKTRNGGVSKYDNDQISFKVENSDYYDVACVQFKDGRGLNKIEHRNAEIPMLYIMNNGENFGAANMPDNTDVINLGFEAKTMGQYTISLKAEGQYSYMHLVDKLTGNDIDMLVEDSYTFVGTPNDRNDRFVLRLNYNAAGIDTESDIFAYQSGNDIMVSGEGELQVFDITGRKVMTTDINGVETINGMNRGVYIFRLNEKTQKIVVR